MKSEISKPLLHIASMVLAFILAIFFIRNVLMKTNQDFNDAGLGEGSVKYTPSKNGVPIHVTEFKDIVYISDSADKSCPGCRNILWLGNSQLHGINQYSVGDKNSVEYLYDSLLPRKIRVSAFSLPNANLQEHYVALKYLATRIRLSEVILPVFFDDTRESGIRADLVRPEVSAVIGGNDNTELGKAIQSAFQASSMEAGEDADMKALESTTQERVEFYLNDRMNNASQIWNSRSYLRSVIIYDYIFKTRNTVFGIDPNSKRKVIPARYKLNMEAFQRIASFCRDSQIRLLVYIPPIRDDAEQPYYREEYEAFKKELVTYASTYGFDLRNYESVIPARYWGSKQSTTLGGKLEIDFMHFQSTGHKLLADEVIKEFSSKTQAE